MVPKPRSGTLSPTPTYPVQTGSHNLSHTTHLYNSASSSPTGSSNITNLVVTQVYFLLSALKDDDKWDSQVEQLYKLICDNGMEVYAKFFARLVASNAVYIFSASSRSSNVPNPANYQLLTAELSKLISEPEQARQIAESIETGSEDVYRDFDLSTFMDHFKLDALQKVVLASAFKLGNRQDLKIKADAIISTNLKAFKDILSRPDGSYREHLSTDLLCIVLDRVIQYPPPNLPNIVDGDPSDFFQEIRCRYLEETPSPLLAILNLYHMLNDNNINGLARYMQQVGFELTHDETTCVRHLQIAQSRPLHIQLTPTIVSNALLYSCISQTPKFNTSNLVHGLRHCLPSNFSWPEVIHGFDNPNARISPHQFLELYNSLIIIANDASLEPKLDIQTLWGTGWNNHETALSFVSAFASHYPETLDISSIPGFSSSISLDMYISCSPAVQERAAYANRHPLSSVSAMTTVFRCALDNTLASSTAEAKRLFQAVIPTIDIFLVSSFSVPHPWPGFANETLATLFSNFYTTPKSQHRDFVFESLWKKDSQWVVRQLVDIHLKQPNEIPRIFEMAVKYDWLNYIASLETGFSFDLVAYAHAQGHIDLQQWARDHQHNPQAMAMNLIQFLNVKANMRRNREADPQSAPETTSLHVKTIYALLNIIDDFLGHTFNTPLTQVQRDYVTAYPRLVNYGEGFDDIIDANSLSGNTLPAAANNRMEEHYKRMYSGDTVCKEIVETLRAYKHSRNPLDQDTFACMIHGLFDEFNHFREYPVQALATTAVLFGGIISHSLVAGFSLKISLEMILEAVRDYPPDKPMFKFGLQALKTFLPRLREWPGFCRQLYHIEPLVQSETWATLKAAIEHSDEAAPDSYQRFTCINIDPRMDIESEPPSDAQQDRFKFLLNNVSEDKLMKTCEELRSMLEPKYMEWFAHQLVEERAKGQPNYHTLYLDIVNILNDKELWDEVLRETYMSIDCLLNLESNVSGPKGNDRAHLKSLAGWLGLLTLARDKPVKQKNIAFKQLLLEAYEWKRLSLVIPFVCKVLIQGAQSTVFKPPNPWLMDIIQLLIAIYHEPNLIKLNLKFEIEVLCKGLNLDHRSIIPPEGILQRPLPVPISADLPLLDRSEAFEPIGHNNIPPSVPMTLSQQNLITEIPDITEQLTIPPTNELILSTVQLTDLVKEALTRAISEIIQPVVDRSVTIAAISTQQLITKDFAIEPDENKLRNSAINMAKSTAGSLALVTCKDPLKQTFTSYMRQLGTEAGLNLPEGTLLMCVNSNIEVGCKVIEKSAESRAVPEIEHFLTTDIEARRQHRAQKPHEPFLARPVDRWSSAILEPYRLHEHMTGLTPEQMAIYEKFGRNPRVIGAGVPSLPTPLAETRQQLGDPLQDQFTVGTITPMNTLSDSNNPNQGISSLAPQYIQTNSLVSRVLKLSHDLSTKVSAASELANEHFANIPRQSNPIIDVYDHLMTAIISVVRASEEWSFNIAQEMVLTMCSLAQSTLGVETYLSILSQLRGMSTGGVSIRIREFCRQKVTQHLINKPLLLTLLQTDLLEWPQIDMFIAQGLGSRNDSFLQLLNQIIQLALLNDQPVIFYADIVHSLEAVWLWIQAEPDNTACQQLKLRLEETSLIPPSPMSESNTIVWEQFEYIFQEWTHICTQPGGDRVLPVFLKQMRVRQVLSNKDDLFVLVRVALEMCVTQYEAQSTDQVYDGLLTTEALSRLIGICLSPQSPILEEGANRSVFLSSLLAVIRVVMYYHHTLQGEHFAQRIYYKLLCLVILHIQDLEDCMDIVSQDDIDVLMLAVAKELLEFGPRYLPDFYYGWMHLLQHRVLLSTLLRSQRPECEAAFTDLLVAQLSYLGEQLKSPDVHDISKDIYRATLKLLLILNHDFPEYLTRNHNTLCRHVPYHCAQIVLVLVTAAPPNAPVRPLRLSSLQDCTNPDALQQDTTGALKDLGLLDIVDESLENGPSEAAVAHIAHAICHSEKIETTFCHVPVPANSVVIENVVIHIANYGLLHNVQVDSDRLFARDNTGFKLLSMLIREVGASTRYYILAFIGNQLRYPNGYTAYFVYLVLSLFSCDPTDPDATEVRQQITRILLERYIPFWHQPWGVLLTVAELLQNDQYGFYDLPFIKTYPEVAERFSTVLRATS